MRARISALLLVTALGCGAAPGPHSNSTAAPLATMPAAPTAAAPLSFAAASSATAAPAGPVPTLPAEPHPDTRPRAVDIASMPQIRGAAISPDGQQVAYVLREARLDPDTKPSDSDTTGGWKTEAQLWLVSRAGGAPRRLTQAEKGVSSPQWSPDGRTLAFLRSHDKKRAIHLLPVGGGEAEILDLGELTPEDFHFAPDGRSIAFTAAPPRSAAEKESAWRSGGAVDEATRWRSSQLWILQPGSKPRQITKGPEHIVSFRWSPEGRRFAVMTSRSSDPYEASSLPTLRVIAAETGAVVRELEREPRSFGNFAWSPDGRHVAVERAEGTLTLLNSLRVHEVEAGRSWDVAAKLDMTLGGFVWSGDARSLTLLVLERTGSKLVRVPTAGGKPTALGARTTRMVDGISQADRSGRWAVSTSSTPSDPSAPTVVDLQSGALQVVAPQTGRIAGWKIAKTEVVRWKNADGLEIEGIFTSTPHVATGAAPLMVLPHGGPDGVSQERFSGGAQYFAARGFSVLQPNYRGGLAYGHAFYAANRGRLGEIEFADIESGVDALIAAGRVDAQRLYYGGWSWGGYVTAWTIGHTRRYRAAMVGAGIVDVVGQYVGSDINHGVAAQWEFRGNPWKQPEEFAESNPMHSLHQVVTPTLVVHGDQDERVPVAQGRTLYRALADVGCEVRLLTYPREPHGFQEPAHAAHLLASWAAWYAAH